MLLKDTRKGDTVKINDVEFEVLRVSKIRVKPQTLRRHPERMRSKWLVVLRNKKTGRLRSQYFAEFIQCTQVVNDTVLVDHAVKRERSRSIDRENMELVVKYGKPREQLGRLIYELEWEQIKHLKELHNLRSLRVVTNKDGEIITSYRKNRDYERRNSKTY